MRLDLAAACNAISTGQSGKSRAQWSGGALTLDEDAIIGRLASVLATAMGQNLYRGLRPDGSGSMPGRERDGLPRGLGAQVALTLHAEHLGPMQWRIEPIEKSPGHLARILRDVPLRAPPLSSMTAAIRQAFSKDAGAVAAPSFMPTFRTPLMSGVRMNRPRSSRPSLSALRGPRKRTTVFRGRR